MWLSQGHRAPPQGGHALGCYFSPAEIPSPLGQWSSKSVPGTNSGSSSITWKLVRHAPLEPHWDLLNRKLRGVDAHPGWRAPTLGQGSHQLSGGAWVKQGFKGDASFSEVGESF